MTRPEQLDAIVTMIDKIGADRVGGWAPLQTVRSLAAHNLTASTFRKDVRDLVRSGRLERRDNGADLWWRREVALRTPRTPRGDD